MPNDCRSRCRDGVLRKRYVAMPTPRTPIANPALDTQAALLASSRSAAPRDVQPALAHSLSLSFFFERATSPKYVPTPKPTTPTPASTYAAVGGPAASERASARG